MAQCISGWSTTVASTVEQSEETSHTLHVLKPYFILPAEICSKYLYNSTQLSRQFKAQPNSDSKWIITVKIVNVTYSKGRTLSGDIFGTYLLTFSYALRWSCVSFSSLLYCTSHIPESYPTELQTAPFCQSSSAFMESKPPPMHSLITEWDLLGGGRVCTRAFAGAKQTLGADLMRSDRASKAVAAFRGISFPPMSAQCIRSSCQTELASGLNYKYYI